MFHGLKRIGEIWKSAREFYDKQPKVDRRGNELEFLPAAVEILETPASPAGRVSMLLISLLFSIAIAWAWYGKIDIEAVAQGKVIPMGQVKAIQALEIGKVEELLVREGESVVKGQRLIKLDPTETEVDVQQVKKELLENQLNIFRLNLLLEHMDDPEPSPIYFTRQWEKNRPRGPMDAQSDQLGLQQNLLNRDFEVYRSTQASHAANMERQLATIEAVKTEIARLETLKPLFDEQEKAIKKLLDNGHTSTIEWLNAKEKQVETTQGLLVQTSRLHEAQAAFLAIKNEGFKQSREFRSNRLQQLLEFESKAQTAGLALTKAKERESNRYLKAPVDGTVQQLQVHTIGGVVQPAHPLMIIVPREGELEIEAMILNKDIGFIEQGQKVEIKVESFSYTRYGLLPGVVRSISRDSVEQEGIGRVFPMRVAMLERQILVKDDWVPIQPGMSVTVEVKIGKRRLIDFFLAPFLRYQDEGLKER